MQTGQGKSKQAQGKSKQTQGKSKHTQGKSKQAQDKSKQAQDKSKQASLPIPPPQRVLFAFLSVFVPFAPVGMHIPSYLQLHSPPKL